MSASDQFREEPYGEPSYRDLDPGRPDHLAEDIREESTTEHSSLGSLAQAARGKQLNQARWILIAIGVLTIVLNGVQLAAARQIVHEEINKEVQKLRLQNMVADPAEVKAAEDRGVRILSLVAIGTMVLGALFVVFGLIIKMFPVPVTVISLVLYIGAGVVFAVLDPATLVAGLIVKIIIIVALVKAIQAAIAYERERAPSASSEFAHD